MLRALKRFLWRHTVEVRVPDFVIGHVLRKIYLMRWHVIPRNRFFNVYLHRFLQDDDDRALHDHPWFSLSILLQGELVEHTIADGGVHRRKTIHEGAVVFRSPWKAHRIEVPPASRGNVWTLFITGPTLRVWGFHCPQGWKPFQEFVDPQNPGIAGKGCAE